MVDFRKCTGMFALIAFAVIAALFIPAPIIRAGPPGDSPLVAVSVQDLAPVISVEQPAMVWQPDELPPGELIVQYAADNPASFKVCDRNTAVDLGASDLGDWRSQLNRAV